MMQCEPATYIIQVMKVQYNYSACTFMSIVKAAIHTHYIPYKYLDTATDL